MTSPFKTLVDEIHENLADITNDTSRGRPPYYEWGVDKFIAGTGRPPQVRYTLGPATLEEGRIKSGLGVTGSIATWNQEIMVRVWGADEESTLNETLNLIRAMKETEGLERPDVGTVFEWGNTDDHARSQAGFTISFSFFAPVQVGRRGRTVTPLVSASIIVSSSIAVASGTIGSGSLWISGSQPQP